MRKLWMGGLIALILLATEFATAEAPPSPFIQGKSDQYGWEIDVQGSAGTFTVGDEVWSIELFYDRPGQGQGGFANSLWFLGRKEGNYILLFAFVNTSGNSFAVWFFDYKKAEGLGDTFTGEYNIRGIRSQPSLLEGYVPQGKVPDYIGYDFRVASPYSRISPAEGDVHYEQLQLEVYPVYQVNALNEWNEFWMIGVNPQSLHTYNLIYYSNQHRAWVIDLWNGYVSLLPLGQAIIIGGQVQVPHSVTLGS